MLSQVWCSWLKSYHSWPCRSDVIWYVVILFWFPLKKFSSNGDASSVLCQMALIGVPHRGIWSLLQLHPNWFPWRSGSKRQLPVQYSKRLWTFQRSLARFDDLQHVIASSITAFQSCRKVVLDLNEGWELNMAEFSRAIQWSSIQHLAGAWRRSRNSGSVAHCGACYGLRGGALRRKCCIAWMLSQMPGNCSGNQRADMGKSNPDNQR